MARVTVDTLDADAAYATYAWRAARQKWTRAACDKLVALLEAA